MAISGIFLAISSSFPDILGGFFGLIGAVLLFFFHALKSDSKN